MGGTPKVKSTQDTTGTTTSRLPGGQQANVDLLMQGARDFYNSGGPQFFPGQTYAGTTGDELAGRTAARGFATGAGQNFVDQTLQGEQFWLNPENIFNPQNIPGFRQSQDYVKQALTRNLTESILPELRGGSVAQGVLGGSRQEIGEGLAAGRTGDAIGQALSGMELGAYGMGQNMYNAAASRAPSMFNFGLAPADTLTAVGQAERADTQLGIDENVARFNFEQLAPLLNLEAFKELIGRAGDYGGTVDLKQSQVGTSKQSGGGLSQALGAALSLAALIPSHSSLKQNIEPAADILTKLNGLGIYTWEYKGIPTRHIGPMAEEFQQVFGVGDGVTLNGFDVLGVLLGAVKELSLKLQVQGA